MAKVSANMSMSLDGFVSHPSDGIDQLFRWYGNGDVAVRTADPDMTFKVSEASAQRLNRGLSEVGVLVYGRRTFDDAGGWIGGHPMGKPVIVVSHSIPDGWPRADTPLTFVTDGVESAIAQAKATAAWEESRHRQRRPHPAVHQRRAAGRAGCRPGAAAARFGRALPRQPARGAACAGGAHGDRGERRDSSDVHPQVTPVGGRSEPEARSAALNGPEDRSAC